MKKLTPGQIEALIAKCEGRPVTDQEALARALEKLRLGIAHNAKRRPRDQTAIHADRGGAH